MGASWLTVDEREDLCIGGDCDVYGYMTHSVDCGEHLAVVEALLARRVAGVERARDEWRETARRTREWAVAELDRVDADDLSGGTGRS